MEAGHDSGDLVPRPASSRAEHSAQNWGIHSCMPLTLMLSHIPVVMLRDRGT